MLVRTNEATTVGAEIGREIRAMFWVEMKWSGKSKIRVGCNVELQPGFCVFVFSQLAKGISKNFEVLYLLLNFHTSTRSWV